METSKTNFYEVLKTNGTLVFTNKGVSMLPLLRQDKDVMIIKKGVPPYKKYDAVLFMRPNGQYILHRIMKLHNKSYYIIGDNCIAGEEVSEEQIIGVLTSIKRNGKIISVEDRGYKLFVHFWWAIFPLRKCKKKLDFFITRVKGKIYRVIKGK